MDASQSSSNWFVGEVARTYDQSSPRMFSADVLGPTVDCLEALAEGGSVLEFAIGTGRVAIPLAARGVEVAGIDLSGDMLAQLRAKPEAAGIRIVEGDMAVIRVDGEFSLIYLVFNTISNLTTQEEQVACFENAARHLRRGGRFVIENGVPHLPPPRQRGEVSAATDDDYIGIDEITDRSKQLFRSRHLRRQPDGSFREFSAPFRWVTPAELDLMARLAGMSLEHRWSGWDRSPFTSTSRAHVSVWQTAL